MSSTGGSSPGSKQGGVATAADVSRDAEKGQVRGGRPSPAVPSSEVGEQPSGGPLLLVSWPYRLSVAGLGSLGLLPLIHLDPSTRPSVLVGLTGVHALIGLWLLGRLLARDVADGPWRPRAVVGAQVLTVGAAGLSVVVGELLLSDLQHLEFSSLLLGFPVTVSLTAIPAWILACLAAPYPRKDGAAGRARP